MTAIEGIGRGSLREEKFGSGFDASVLQSQQSFLPPSRRAHLKHSLLALGQQQTLRCDRLSAFSSSIKLRCRLHSEQTIDS
jgi:hypothetical protein